jgi:hypothetical protein
MLHQRIDKIGSILSLTCAVHCLFLPILLVLLPFGGIAWLADENLELTFIAFSASCAIGSIVYGYIKHKRSCVLFLLTFGLLTIVVAHHYHDSHIGAYLMGCGGFQLACSHYLNMKFCKTCTTCNH